MRGRLIDCRDGLPRRPYLLTAVTAVGRAEDNDIVVADPYVSARHAELCWDGTQYILHDRGSRNGTFLNGARLVTPQVLRGGDRISLAGRPNVLLVFDEDAGTAELPVTHPEPAACWLDRDTAELRVRGARVPLTANEYRAVALLFERAGALVGKDELAARVWPEYGGAVADYNIQQLVGRLRRKLETEAGHPPLLLTVRGLGYRLVLA